MHDAAAEKGLPKVDRAMPPLEGRNPKSMQLNRLTRIDWFKLGRVDAVPAFQVVANLRWRHNSSSSLLGHHGSIQIVFVMPVGEADNVGSGEIFQMGPLGTAFRAEKTDRKAKALD